MVVPTGDETTNPLYHKIGKSQRNFTDFGEGFCQTGLWRPCFVNVGFVNTRFSKPVCAKTWETGVFDANSANFIGGNWFIHQIALLELC